MIIASQSETEDTEFSDMPVGGMLSALKEMEEAAAQSDGGMGYEDPWEDLPPEYMIEDEPEPEFD